jgi:osmotically-inducible protein OsmY
MTRYAPLVLIALATSTAIACDNLDATDTTRTTAATTQLLDDSKLNPNEPGTRAALSQSNAPADLVTTQVIREALMTDDGLSTSAKNVAVITSNGTITLRGTVNTDAEKQNVDGKAIAAAGQNRVDDRIDVVTRN